ncbi:Uncharacterized protein OBRU01_23585, partial [Operophtera brumata]
MMQVLQYQVSTPQSTIAADVAQHYVPPPPYFGVRCVFEGVSECGVVHGALYWCLRGVFALSVSAVLVCIFSCMLAYQLL